MLWEMYKVVAAVNWQPLSMGVTKTKTIYSEWLFILLPLPAVEAWISKTSLEIVVRSYKQEVKQLHVFFLPKHTSGLSPSWHVCIYFVTLSRHHTTWNCKYVGVTSWQ